MTASPGASVAGRLAERRVLVDVSDNNLAGHFSEALACAGAQVVLLGNGAAPVADNVYSVQIDHCSRSSVQQGFIEAEGLLGGVDLVIHSAAAELAVAFTSLDSLGHTDWTASVDAILKRTLYMLQASHSVFAGGRGAILLAGPSLAFTGARGLVALCSALEGQRALAKCAARQFGPQGITVNWLALSSEYFSPEFQADRLPQSPELGPPPLPLGQAPSLDDVAAFIGSLDLTNNAVMTGASINLDGGQWMMP